MKKEVIDTFAKLIPEFEKGIITFDCADGVPYNFKIKMNFDINLDGTEYCSEQDLQIPCLVLHDAKKFFDLLTQTVKVRWDFHKNELPEMKEEEYLKYLIAFTFINMTAYDFANPNKYLEDLIKMYDEKNRLFPGKFNQTDKSFETDLGEIELDEKYQLSVITEKESITLETPYSYTFVLRKGEDSYYFPSIFASKVDNKLIVRAIQTNRTFIQSYELVDDIEEYIKNNIPKDGLNNKKVSYLRSVNPCFVVALNTLIQRAKDKKGIDIVELPTFSPMRYNNKKDAMIFNAKRNSKDEEEYKEKVEKSMEKLEEIQDHITNKFLYTALRLEHHLDGYQVLDYGEISSSLIMKIKDSKNQYKLFDSFTNNNNRKR